ncbi:copper resistance protein CopC [Myceligenerans crystallogenes]|uniref:Copper resistance protein CopC n=1 Tax=Myceligenerans crystallogenes TaxID=316335 RepID=A0ABN2N8K4_9MICO
MRPSRRWVAVLGSAVAGILLVLLPSVPATAHAVLTGTDPADGTVLQEAPARLTISFNEPVQAVADATTLLTAQGDPVAATVKAVDDDVVVTPAQPLADGTYVVAWRVVSLDSHPISGAFSFSVGAPSGTPADVTAAVTAPAEPGTAVTVARAVTQATGYAGTFLVAGLVVFELFVLHATPGAVPVLRRRIRRLRLLALLAAAVALVAGVPVTAAWQAGAGLADVLAPGTWAAGLASDTALAGGLNLAGLLLAALAAPRASSDGPAAGARTPGPLRRITPAAAAGLALGGSALALGALVVTGHTRTFGPWWLVLASDLTHVTAGAVWLAGVTGLALALTPSSGLDPRRAAVTVTRFSALGAWLALVVALTGLTLGWRILGTLEALLGTDYGRSLLVKAGLVLCVVALAAWNRYRLVPAVTAGATTGGTAGGTAGAARALRRTVLAEAVLLGAVLAVTGVLVSNSPVPAATDAGGQAAAASGGAPAAPEPAQATQETGDGTITARVTPGGLGVNALEIEIVGTDGEPLEPVEPPAVAVTLADPAIGPFTPAVNPTGPGTYEAVVDLTMPGSWTVAVSVRTSKYENPVVDVPVEVTQ